MSTQYSGRAAMMAKMASMAGSLRDDGAAPVRPRERASDGRTHPSARPVGTPRSRAPLRAGSRRAARARRRVVGSAAPLLPLPAAAASKQAAQGAQGAALAIGGTLSPTQLYKAALGEAPTGGSGGYPARPALVRDSSMHR